MTSAPARMAARVSSCAAASAARVLAGNGISTTVRRSSCAELVELLGLVLGTEAREDVEQRVVARGALDLAAGGAQLELGEVRARGVAREIARAEH